MSLTGYVPPLLLLALAWLGGLALGRLPAPWQGGWLLAATTVAVLLGRRSLPLPWPLALATLAVAALGLARGWPPAPALVPSLPADVVAVRGTVLDWPRSGEREQTTRLAVTEIEHGGAWQPQATTVAARLPLFPALIPGDTIEARGSLRRLDSRRDDLVDQMSVRRLTLLDRQPVTGPATWRVSVIQAVTAALERALPARMAGLAVGVLLGDRSGLSPELRAAFAATGTSHLLVVSGWNVSLVVGLVMWLVLRLRLRHTPLGLLLALVAIAGFTLLVGADPAVVRAALMGGIAVTALAIGRPADPLTSLTVTVALMAGLQPALLSDLGFQLSALATLGLLLVMPPLKPCLAALPAAARWPVEALAATLAASVAVQPLLTATFGQLSLIAPLANLLAAPWVPLVMAGGVAVAVLGLAAAPILGDPFVPVLSDLAGWATMLAIAPLLAVVEIGAALPLATVALPPPPPAVTLTLYVLLAVLALPLLTPAPALTTRRALAAARAAWPAIGLVSLAATAGAIWFAVAR